MTTITDPIVFRAAHTGDRAALRRLAALDSARPIAADALIAEVGGEPVAAIAVADGRIVADPFRPTADVVELLTRRRDQLVGARTFSQAGSPLRAIGVRALARVAGAVS